MKYQVFFSKDCMMYGVEFDTGKGFKQQALPPSGCGGRSGESAYTYYEGVAKRWATILNAKARLEELRHELEAERISYSELAELQDLAKYIDDGDVQLLEAAGVPEGSR